MKILIRSILVNGVALFILSLIFKGVRIEGGLVTLALAGVLLSLMSFLLKPILTIISIPFNLLTFGLFSFFSSVILLYLLTILLPQVTISAFVFPGVSIAGFIIPKVAFNTFFAYIVCSFAFSTLINTIKWLFRNEAIF